MKTEVFVATVVALGAISLSSDLVRGAVPGSLSGETTPEPHVLTDSQNGDSVKVERTSPPGHDQPLLNTLPGGGSDPASGEISSRRRKIMKMMALSSATVAVVSTLTAYWYMSRAEAANDRYLQAGHPGEMDRYFHQAESYDRKAGYSLVLFEISFAVALYSFISSLTP
ncbi:MAG: hypothetical protein ACE5GH_02490 [Fidelibacterota bacterium]